MTAALGEAVDDHAEPVRHLANFVARQPLGRLGTPEEVAAVAVHLASVASAFTSGIACFVDGPARGG
jgi:2-keto-3-deoxy-L-fuconate dehydrogenase